MDTINNAITLHDKLTSFVENALYDVELDALCEANDGASNDKEKGQKFAKLKAIAKAVWEGFKWLGKKISAAWKWIVNKVANFVNRNDATVVHDMEISQLLVKKISGIPAYKEDKAEYWIKELSMTKTLKAGDKINIKSLMGNVKNIEKIIDDMNKRIGRINLALENGKEIDTGELQFYNNVSKILSGVIKDVHIIGNEILFSVEKFNKMAKKTSVEPLKESINDTRMLRVRLLMEAAELLNEDGEAENSNLVDGAANMVDDTIKDIPDSYEEEPFADDDYDAETVMGATSERVSDETKQQLADLCDGDKEVIDIITDDDGSAIIDNSNESISDSFEFLW